MTGHTSGIGLALYDKFLKLGYDVLGYSRSTGYDIGTNAIYNILDQSTDCDLFVNNAYHKIGQNKILQELLKNWEGTDKCIVNISSNIVNTTMPLTSESAEYKNVKQLSNQIINNYKGSIKILNVLPDLVNTNFYLGGELLKHGMSPIYVAEVIVKHIGQIDSVEELIIRKPI